MAWDTEGTRRKLIDAGVTQFAAAGFAGARIDAIAREAGVNKERVYSYFGDKEGLFSAVLAHELTALLDGITLEGPDSDVVEALAGELYDRYAARPALPRLLAWESLELDAPVSAADRCAMCADVADCIAEALGIPRARAEQLLIAVITRVTGAFTLSHVAAVVVGQREHSAADVRRAVVAEAAALAVAARVASATTPSR
jgi:AcrR family transcriptional regulator